MSAGSGGIALPAGVEIRLCIIAPHHLVLVSPPGTKAEPEMMVRPGGVAGLFTHDPGLTWPDREGCRAATEYLANGCPICLQFVALADAIACHRRLKAETVR